MDDGRREKFIWKNISKNNKILRNTVRTIVQNYCLNPHICLP